MMKMNNIDMDKNKSNKNNRAAKIFETISILSGVLLIILIWFGIWLGGIYEGFRIHWTFGTIMTLVFVGTTSMIIANLLSKE